MSKNQSALLGLPIEYVAIPALKSENIVLGDWSSYVVPVPEWVVMAAQALFAQWEIGNSSTYPGKPGDWNSANVEDVAKVIWEEHLKHSVNKSG